ncbi:MAG: carboxypeptidase-like regulatory domain-containing protein [Bryobacteraceae bacterium]
MSGRVTMAGASVNLASVVAISPNGAAVSTLTNPDGTYRIDGLSPRTYLVYVHPLPPPIRGQTTNGGIVYPRDADGRFVGPGNPFETVFYPNVKSPQAAVPLSVGIGSLTENINFAVRARSGYGIHTVETYSFPADTVVKPAYIGASTPRPFLVVTGTGLMQSGAPAPGLGVTVLGGSSLPIRPYESAPAAFLQVDFDVRT